MKNNMFFKKEKSSKIWYLLCFLAIIITFFCYFFWQEKYYSFNKISSKLNFNNYKKSKDKEMKIASENLPTWDLSDLYS